jgi:hypothetical protein
MTFLKHTTPQASAFFYMPTPGITKAIAVESSYVKATLVPIRTGLEVLCSNRSSKNVGLFERYDKN